MVVGRAHKPQALAVKSVGIELLYVSHGDQLSSIPFRAGSPIHRFCCYAFIAEESIAAPSGNKGAQAVRIGCRAVIAGAIRSTQGSDVGHPGIRCPGEGMNRSVITDFRVIHDHACVRHAHGYDFRVCPLTPQSAQINPLSCIWSDCRYVQGVCVAVRDIAIPNDNSSIVDFAGFSPVSSFEMAEVCIWGVSC